MKFPNLFKPIQIGNQTVKNRLFMPPLSTNLGNKGYVTDELVEHYKARAKGGVGLFITEVVTVEPTYVYLPGDMSIYDDSFIPGWKKLVDGVHEYGAKILPQLFHPAYMAFPIPGTPQLIAPSHVGPHYAKSAPRPVSIEELKIIIKQFGEAAYRVKQAGGDGVEIHAAHAHGLLGGFLSPLYNKRCDEYGGDIDGRLKLTLDVVKEVRAKCGNDFIIDVRISGDEYQDGANNLTDMLYVAKQLEKAGIDMLHVSGGTTIARGSAIPAPGTKFGSHSQSSEAIKKVVSIPVLSVGRITEAWFAEEMIANNKCDAVLMGRAVLCDPEFANKAYEGRIDDIRPCIGCLKCLNTIMFGKRVSCSVNPSFELVNEETVTEAPNKKNILVVGGGPAGLEAAYVAKKRGHNVVLCEKENELGGLLRCAAVPIGKQDLTKVIKYMKKKVYDTGVEVRLNTLVTKEMLENEFKDYEVISSIGATPIIINPFTKFKNWMTAEDILMGRKFPGLNCVIIGGGSVGCETADFLAPTINDRFIRNRKVTVIEMDKEILLKEVGAVRSALVLRMMKKGINILVNTKVEEVTEDTITYSTNGVSNTITDADTLIFASGYRTTTTFEEILKEVGCKYTIIGDQAKPSSLRESISQGFEATKEI